MTDDHSIEDETLTRGHEPDVVNARVVVISAAGLTGLVVGALLLMGVLWGVFSEEAQLALEPASDLRKPRIEAGPEFTPNQSLQLQRLRHLEEQRLHSYAWLDQDAGLARIPIGRAMELLAQGGLKSNKDNASTEIDQPAEGADD